jgi:hypothetical protein
MESFDEHWLTRGALDAEYKQYVLLAWLQKVKQEFRATRLYPALAELIAQHRHLTDLASNREGLTLRGEVTGFDFRSMRLLYSAAERHPELDAYIDELLHFAIPQLRAAIEEGKDLYEIVEEHIEFLPVGLMPLYRTEGYLLIHDAPRGDVFAYRYARSRIERDDEQYLALEVEPVDRFRRSLGETFESIKHALIRQFRELPNPATFCAVSTLALPLQETLLPVAKRRLMRELATS